MAKLTSTDIYGSLYVQGTQTTGSLTTLGTFLAPLGTALLPSYTFSGDLNTGIFSPGADILAFSTNGSEKLRIASNGDITTLAGAKLNLYNINNYLSYNTWESTSSTTTILNTNAIDGKIVLSTSSVERMRIDKNGNIGIGTTNPVTKLDVDGNINIRTGGNYLTFNNGDMMIRNTSGYNMTFHTYTGSALTEKIRITTDGKVGIGTTSPTSKLHIVDTAGNEQIKVDSGASGNFVISQGGGITYLRSSALLSIGSNGANDAIRLDNGKVGIGTTSPAGRLSVVDSVASNTATVLTVNNAGTGSSGWIADFQKSGVSKVTIDNNGDIRTITGILNRTSINNSSVQTLTTGTVIARNISDANPSLVVDLVNATSTGNIQEWKSQGVLKSFIDGSGLFKTSIGIANSTTANNALVSTSTLGTTISRNIADANPALIVNQSNSSSTGNIQQWKFNNVTLLSVDKFGVIYSNQGIRSTDDNLRVITATSGLDVNKIANTGDIATFKYNDGKRFTFSNDGVFKWGPTANIGVLTWDTGKAIIGTQGSGGDLDINTNGTAKIQVKTDGNVGIGWSGSNIIDKLTVNGNITVGSTGYIRSNTYQAGTGGSIRLNASNTASDQYVAFGVNISGSAINFTERMRLTTDGKLGIGTTTPGALLHLNSTSDSSIRSTWTNTGGLGEWTLYENSTYKGGLSAFGSTFTTPTWRDALVLTAATNNLGKIIFRTRNNASYIESLTIANDGNIGIGVSAPSEKLHVVGNGYFTGNVTVDGSIDVKGTVSTINTENVNIKDNIIQLNSNQTGTPSSLLKSGIEVNRGTSTNYQFLFDESDDTFRIGEAGSLQPVLTRDESQNLTNGNILAWDSTNYRAITRTLSQLGLAPASGGTYNEITVTNDAIGDLPLIVNGVTGTAGLQDWRLNNVLKAFMHSEGRLYGDGLANISTVNNSRVQMGDTGTTISRNIADANTALVVNLANASANGYIAAFQKAGVNQVAVDSNGTVRLSAIYNINSGNNAAVSTSTNGTVISRNIGDANTALIVNQTHASSTGDILKIQAEGSDKFVIKKDGNVGIGTSTPSSPLEISGTGNQDLRVTSTNGSDVSLTFIRATDATFDSRIRNTWGNVLFERSANDGTSWTTNMFLGGDTTYNTRVGIGTETPQRRLSIVTTSNDDGIQIRRNSDTANSYASLAFRTNTTEAATNYGEIRSIRTNRAVGGDSDLALYAFTNGAQIEGLRIRDDGNVGIGTADPGTYKLKVTGAGFFNGLSSAASVVVADGSLTPSSADGVGIFVGSTTTPIASFTFNNQKNSLESNVDISIPVGKHFVMSTATDIDNNPLDTFDPSLKVMRGNSSPVEILWKEEDMAWKVKDADFSYEEKKIFVEWDTLDGGTW